MVKDIDSAFMTSFFSTVFNITRYIWADEGSALRLINEKHSSLNGKVLPFISFIRSEPIKLSKRLGASYERDVETFDNKGNSIKFKVLPAEWSYKCIIWSKKVEDLIDYEEKLFWELATPLGYTFLKDDNNFEIELSLESNNIINKFYTIEVLKSGRIFKFEFKINVKAWLFISKTGASPIIKYPIIDIFSDSEMKTLIDDIEV